MNTELQFIINLTAIILGPVIAVVITLTYQKHRTEQETKNRLFLKLMAQRKSFPPSFAWVESLNLIDVVFAKHPTVVQLWHDYYDCLHSETQDYAKRDHKYLELLSAMAQCLGYKDIQQTDIDKFYTPIAHGDQAELNHKVQIELLRVLENTDAFQTYLKENSTQQKNIHLTANSRPFFCSSILARRLMQAVSFKSNNVVIEKK